jgi:hypothetical protein
MFLVRFVVFLLIRFLCSEGEICSPPHTKNGAIAKVVPLLEIVLCKMLMNNHLQTQIILIYMDRMAFPDQREQKALENP